MSSVVNKECGIGKLNTFKNHFAKKGEKDNFLSYFLLLLLFLFLFTGKVYGTKGGKVPGSYNKDIPLSLIYMNSEEESYAILIEKQTQRLFLYGYLAGKIELIKSFPCSTGKNSGDKKKRGDRKTPEGVYFFTRVFEDEELEPRYGVEAFVLDYPNYFDRLQKKDGRGIWLHGTNKPLTPCDSKGCIALNNQDILELSKYISLYFTPIIILERIEYVTEEEIEKKKGQLKTFINKWLSSWENKELLSYMSCYAKDFRSKGMGWQQWKRYKDSLNKKYREIKISIDKLQGFKHNHYGLFTFRQDYRSDVLKSKGIKRLYLREDGGEFKITGEEWNRLRGGYLPSKEKPSTKTVSSKKEDDLKIETEKIAIFIERWRRYWEDKELEEYISCYSKNFKAQGIGRQRWKILKSVLYKKYKNIKVNITNAEINIKDGGKRAEVSFLQQYQSDQYGDKGLKRLLLKKEEGKWKIVSEKWNSL